MTRENSTSSTLHQRILNDIETKIVSGAWPPGHRLPFEVDLAKSYDVSRMTVNKVMTQLAKSGLIERRKKSGSFVAQPRIQSAILEIHDIEAEVHSLNVEYSFEIASLAVRHATATDLSSFETAEAIDVLDIRCLHFAGNQVFCVEERLINLNEVPQARDASFSEKPPGVWLLNQVPWNAAEHKIFAVNAGKSHAALLDIPNNAACLVVQRRTWGGSGPVTFVRFTYPGDKHAIAARFTPASS